MDFTLLLPKEIILHILSYLEGDEIFPLLGVSRRWRGLLNYDDFWKPFCLKARIFDSSFPSSGKIFVYLYQLPLLKLNVNIISFSSRSSVIVFLGRRILSLPMYTSEELEDRNVSLFSSTEGGD